MTCDFLIDMSAFPAEAVAPTIERDRMQMFGAPHAIGGSVKYIPFGNCSETAPTCWSGGRYLFDTAAHAATYRELIDEYDYGGTLFLQRPEFVETACFAWNVIGAASYDGDDEYTAIRTLRWAVPAQADLAPFLSIAWPMISYMAETSGVRAAWLLYSQDHAHVSLVLYGDDPAALAAIAPILSYSNREVDRTALVLTIWRPFVAGDQGEPSVWPNSPPLPAPICADAVCEPSRGEDALTCPVDCSPTCGDDVCDNDETTTACPSDCFWF